MPEEYWVYAHDDEGQLLEDLGTFPDLNPAITAACDHIGFMVTDDMMTTCVRVVDNKSDSQTVWVAGPIKMVKQTTDDEG